MLDEFGSPIGVDLSATALSLCWERRHGGLTQATVLRLPFADQTFCLVTAFDLFYHRQVGDDWAALRECYRVCKKGGYLLALEPALEWMRCGHDTIHHSRHRYTVRELRERVTAAGFAVERASYINFLLFPLVCTARLAKKLLRPGNLSSDLGPVPGPLNRILKAIFEREGSLVSRFSLPVGSSAACLARKP